ncbi:MAG: hypothetical protein ACKO3T_27720, partial [Planctomycetaceae bacterium]
WTEDLEKYGENRSERDFGAIKTPFAAQQYLTLLPLDDKTLADCQVTVCGYPVDFQPKSGGTPVMVYATSESCMPRNQTIDYVVDTMPGESGSPLLTLVDGNTAAGLGIHNYGLATSADGKWGPKNTATRITPSVKKEIERWINNM